MQTERTPGQAATPSPAISLSEWTREAELPGEGLAAIPLGGEPPPTPEDPYSWHRNGFVQKTRSLAQPLCVFPLRVGV